MVLLTALLALSIPSWRALHNEWQLRQFAETFMSDFTLAQTMAQTQGRFYYLQVVPSLHEYVIRDENNRVVKRVKYDQQIVVGSNFEWLSMPHTVTFNIYGRVQQGGSFRITRGEASAVLTVQLVSGRIRLDR